MSEALKNISSGLGEVVGGLPRSVNIPTNIAEANIMSDTAWATDCFIYGAFSNKLQAYMIGYVSSIFSNYSIYK
ncbi:hypothetical protein D3C87_460040 [compost metagenome]